MLHTGHWHLHPSGERMRRQFSDASSQLSRSRSGSRSRTSDAGSSASDARNGSMHRKRSTSSGSGSSSGGSNALQSDLLDGLPDGPGASYPPAHASAQTLHLFAFPAESNFSGARYGLDLATAVAGGSSCAAALEADPPEGAGKPTEDTGAARPPAAAQQQPRSSGSTESTSGDGNGRWLVVLDAAKACGSHPPNLAAHPVDFVVRAASALQLRPPWHTSTAATATNSISMLPCTAAAMCAVDLAVASDSQLVSRLHDMHRAWSARGAHSALSVWRF